MRRSTQREAQPILGPRGRPEDWLDFGNYGRNRRSDLVFGMRGVGWMGWGGG